MCRFVWAPDKEAEMNVRYRIELSQAEREALTTMLSGGKHAARKLKRAQILLAADGGADLGRAGLSRHQCGQLVWAAGAGAHARPDRRQAARCGRGGAGRADMRDKLIRSGAVPAATSTAEFAQLLREELA